MLHPPLLAVPKFGLAGKLSHLRVQDIELSTLSTSVSLSINSVDGGNFRVSVIIDENNLTQAEMAGLLSISRAWVTMVLKSI